MARKRAASRQSDRQHAIDEIARACDIVAVAEACGMAISAMQTATPKTRCPFHKDNRPSLHLFRKRFAETRDHFHCFSCQAHGDVVDLVKQIRDCDFSTAIEWLSRFSGVSLPKPSSRTATTSLTTGGTAFELANEIYAKPSKVEQGLLDKWVAKRGLPTDVLEQAGVVVARANKLSATIGPDRELLDGLRSVGLVRRVIPSTKASVALLDLPDRDFFSSDRIIFPIRTETGQLVAFAGRALGGEEPKYLYTPGFRRSRVLYRLGTVIQGLRKELASRQQTATARPFHLFIVEGLVDALRLECLGLNTVAVLGSALTDGQLVLLTRLAEEVEQRGRSLAVHVFLDADDAGRRGTVTALAKLMRCASERAFFLVDAICPPTENASTKSDPDDLLRDQSSAKNAFQLLSTWAKPALEVLLAEAFACPVNDLSEYWTRQTSAQQILTFRHVERRFDRKEWPQILDRLVPFSTCFDVGQTSPTAPWIEPFQRFLRHIPAATTPDRPEATTIRLARDAERQLLHALQLAHSSTQRRELPTDEGSWSRMMVATDVVLPYLAEHLRLNVPPFVPPFEPMVAAAVPKPDGSLRLKALPPPEELVLQQYMLIELLRDYVECSSFAESIPAVRHWGRTGPCTRTTGPEELLPTSGGTISYAYQVDMDVVEGVVPPRREGVFRPYYRCWCDFIDFLDRKTNNIDETSLHVGRLDVRRYYDCLSRSAVIDVLGPGVAKAMSRLEEDTEVTACAPLFVPTLSETYERASRIVDWLCDQSFGYSFLRPSDGRPETRDRLRGVPQGPDLSAYLANVALFPVDRAADEVAQEIGGVYARYVDDIVVVAKSGAGLRRLRSVIEDQLARLGLDLNEKSEILDPMSKPQFRAWLTDRRGGLGVSGPFAGPPANQPLILADPLADAGEFERDDALTLLHDPMYLDPETPKEEVLRAIRLARSAPELRHNDFVKAARILWPSVIDELDQQAVSYTVGQIVATFVTSWEKTQPAADQYSAQAVNGAIPHGRVAPTLFAWLDGLDAFLRGRPDRNPTFSREAQRRLRACQIRLAEAVKEHLCSRLLAQLSTSEDATSEYQHFLHLKILNLYLVASLLSPEPPKSPPDFLPHLQLSAAIRRVLFSLHERWPSLALVERAVVRDDDPALLGPRMLFHEALTRLQTATSAVPDDPLASMKLRLEQITALHVPGPEGLLGRFLACWLPTPSLPTSGLDDVLEPALRTLTNASAVPFSQLIHNRRGLAGLLLSHGTTGDVRLIPAPPGVGVPGILGVRDSQRLYRVDLVNKVQVVPAELRWKELKPFSIGESQWPRLSTSLKNKHLLIPLASGSDSPSAERATPRQQLLWLASAFRKLAQGDRLFATERVCPPTAYNVVGPSVTHEAPDREGFELLGYLVPCDNVADQAFIRYGRQSLVAEPIPQVYRPLWQIGTALADILDYIHQSQSIQTIRLSRESNAQEIDADWISEKLLHVAVYRLRGLWQPTGPLAEDESTGWPRTVVRVIEAMERFAGEVVEEDLRTGISSFVGMLAEGRALHARYGDGLSHPDPSSPGGGTSLLAEITKTQFASDSSLTNELPTVSFLKEGLRRPVLAWLQLAERIEALRRPEAEEAHDATLKAVAAGARIVCLESQLRAVALEMWTTLSQTQRRLLADSPPDLTGLSLDESWLLHRGADGPGLQAQGRDEITPAPELHGPSSKTRANRATNAGPSNVVQLLEQIVIATEEGSTRHWGRLENTTPLGWACLLACILGPLQDNPAPGNSLRNTPGDDLLRDRHVTDGFRRLIQKLALAARSDSAEPADVPWDDLGTVVATWQCDALLDELNLLATIQESLGINLRQKESPYFLVGNVRGDKIELRTDDGVRHVNAWQFVVGSCAREGRRSGIEAVRREDDDRLHYRWTEAWQGDQLLGIHAVRPGLVEWAGLDDARTVSTPSLKTTPPDDDIAPRQSVEDGAPPRIGDAETEGTSPSPPDKQITDKDEAPRIRTIRPSAPASDVDKYLKEFQSLQLNAWETRRRRPDSHLRIALLQWEVDDSYVHPILEACHRDNTKVARAHKNPEIWAENLPERPLTLPSCAEYRRQRILREVLEACSRFDVDVLLLPEYSVRPETVAWIRNALPQYAKNTWVWAGTFRMPPFFQFASPLGRQLLDEAQLQSYRDWASIMCVVSPQKEVDGRVLVRKKKYPAVGLGELFAPSDDAFSPVFNKPEDLRNRLLELICSEVFIVTSPSNLHAAAFGYIELQRQFGIGPIFDVNTTCDRIVAKDVVRFAKETSISASVLKRRSVLLVPAMTSRAADYTVLGQAGYLAAGLTTVFCNAVLEHYGHGQSCFVGHDGWDRNESHDPGMPRPGPYHGVLPGIFRLSSPDRGCLGKREQAMVIADVDPTYSVEGRPRPQLLPTPLQLVAHLPIVESWQNARQSSLRCRCGGSRKLADDAQSDRNCDWIVPLASAVEVNSPMPDPSTTTIDHPKIEALANALQLLADQVEESRWLRLRAEIFKREHAANPQPWPPPVATDWLWIDLEDPADKNWPEIEVPPYTRLSGDR